MKPATKLLALALAASAPAAGCRRDEVQVADVPRQDIPKEAYSKPMPPDVGKYMKRSAQPKGTPTNLSGTK